MMRLSIGQCVLLAMLAAGVCAAHAQSAPVRDRMPERIVAPYIDMARLPNDLAKIHRESGLRYFTLAFVNAAADCTPVWPGALPVSADKLWAMNVRKLRRQGGDVIIAFGGYDGTELAQVCNDAATLAAAYEQVLAKYKPIALDFDIEHLAIEDQPSIDRRSQALRLLAERNPSVCISLTLPATPAGLTEKSMNVLASAMATGARIDLVNLMTMDYGRFAETKQMGDNAIAAAQAATVQLQQLGMHARLGITPMLGVNDVAGETFTLTDAAALTTFARQNTNVALLAYWSIARDNGSCSAQLSPLCSGVQQTKWQFATIFTAFVKQQPRKEIVFKRK
jgi:hypothetical protein